MDGPTCLPKPVAVRCTDAPLEGMSGPGFLTALRSAAFVPTSMRQAKIRRLMAESDTEHARTTPAMPIGRVSGGAPTRRFGARRSTARRIRAKMGPCLTSR